MIKNRQLPVFAEERYAICKQCDQYKNDNCLMLVAKGKAGYLFHENGIINKRTRCPKRLFNSFRSLHSILISLFIRGLNDDEAHYWTKHNVSTGALLDAIYRLYVPDGLTRSELRFRLGLIATYPNDYTNPKNAVEELSVVLTEKEIL